MNPAFAPRPDPLRARAGAWLEGILNHLLALDPDRAAELVRFSGRRIVVELRGFDLAFALHVREQHLAVEPAGPTADLRLRATPVALVAHAWRRGAAPLGTIEIAGDLELARALERWLSDFAPELEELCARAFGDVLGVPLARALAATFHGLRRTSAALLRDSAEYLTHESGDLVAPAELEDFLDAVDELSERSERLAARVAEIGRRLREDSP